METVPKQWGEQVFLSRDKPEPGVMESSVSKSSAYCQYRHSDFSVAHGAKNDIDKKHCPWTLAKKWKHFNFSKNMTVEMIVFTVVCIWV